MLQIVVFDTQTLFRLGIMTILEDRPDFRLAGEAGDSVTLFAVLTGVHADMVLLGVNLTYDIICIEIARRLRNDYPAMKILAVASEDTQQTVEILIQAGIDGFIGKRQASRRELEKALRTVAAGKAYIGKIDKTVNGNVVLSEVEASPGFFDSADASLRMTRQYSINHNS